MQQGLERCDYPDVVKELWLCLWEIWHSVINMCCVVLITECHNSHKHSQSHLTDPDAVLCNFACSTLILSPFLLFQPALTETLEKFADLASKLYQLRQLIADISKGRYPHLCCRTYQAFCVGCQELITEIDLFSTQLTQDVKTDCKFISTSILHWEELFLGCSNDVCAMVSHSKT